MPGEPSIILMVMKLCNSEDMTFLVLLLDDEE